MRELLEARELSAGYLGVPVVRRFDLTVGAGEVVALLGPNGAGKTTIMATLAGLLAPIAGTVTVFGAPVAGVGPVRLARNGLSLAPDDRALFPSLSVEENLEVVRRRGARTVPEALELFPALETRRKVHASALSGGEQQMLVLARALLNRPRLLLVDELSMGLAPEIVRSLLPVIREVADESGAGVLLVEQHVELVLGIADQAVVLAHGDVVLREAAGALRGNVGRIEEAYMGVARQTVSTTSRARAVPGSQAERARPSSGR